MNQKWLGGDLATSPGGGYKIKLLIRCMKQFKDEKNLLVMFTDRLVSFFDCVTTK